MNHALGMHWLRYHPEEVDFTHVAAARYASFKLFEWMWSDRDFCRRLLEVARGDAIFLARDHPLSEQKDDMWRDPVGTGQRHADEWAAKVREGRYQLPVDRTYFLGINEPDATSGDRSAIDRYTVAFLDRLRTHGLKGGAFNFSTGHPRTVDGTAATQPDYAFFEASHQAIVRGGHIAVLHIFGSAAEPCMPGHFDRIHACPWQDVTWVVGECGVDEHVATGADHIGYLGALEPYTAYPQWLERLVTGTHDSRIHSWMPFTYDFSHPWGSFDVRAVRDLLAGLQLGDFETEIPSDHEVHLPIIENGNGGNDGGNDGGNGEESETSDGGEHGESDGNTPDYFPRVMDFIRQWEGGYVDHPADPGGATNRGITIGTLSRWRESKGLPAATKEDVHNLTRAEADEIYRAWYWVPSGAAQAKDYATALLLMDSGVLHGVGAPQAWVEEYGLDPWRILARRLRVYTGKDMTQWGAFGRGWTNRVAALLEEMGKGSTT